MTHHSYPPSVVKPLFRDLLIFVLAVSAVWAVLTL